MLKSMFILLLLTIIGTFVNYQLIAKTFSDEPQLGDSTNTNDIEITGIVIDATQTKIGKDFYDLFYQQLNQYEDVPEQSITISERALPQLGSQISVDVEDQLVFLQYIQPRYEIIEQMVEYAMQQTFLYIQNYDEMQELLSGEDLKGTGIY